MPPRRARAPTRVSRGDRRVRLRERRILGGASEGSDAEEPRNSCRVSGSRRSVAPRRKPPRASTRSLILSGGFASSRSRAFAPRRLVPSRSARARSPPPRRLRSRGRSPSARVHDAHLRDAARGRPRWRAPPARRPRSPPLQRDAKAREHLAPLVVARLGRELRDHVSELAHLGEPAPSRSHAAKPSTRPSCSYA